MRMAMSQTRMQFPLSPNKIVKKVMDQGWAIVVLVLAALGLLFFGFDLGRDPILNPFMLSAFVLPLVIILLYLYQRAYYLTYFYDLKEDYLVIRKGVITPAEINIPYERIQDIYVDQDILDRLFGLYDVHLSTATITSGIEAHIDGVERRAAEGLRSLLLQKIREKINKQKIGPSNH
jgi:membrane protein YdbS with pleckstrin-like domain